MVTTELIEYKDGDCTLEAFVAKPEGDPTKKYPCLIVIHAFDGRSQFNLDKATRIATESGKLNYVGFALDVYGKGVIGQSMDENFALVQPFRDDRAMLLRRLLCGLEVARNLSYVDPEKIAVKGFCFGGVCALDLARFNAPVKGILMLHGSFDMPPNLPTEPIVPKILILNGYSDPLAPPDKMIEVCNELTARKADWYLVAFGNAYHAFTTQLHIPNLAYYNKEADERSWRAMIDFCKEMFA